LSRVASGELRQLGYDLHKTLDAVGADLATRVVRWTEAFGRTPHDDAAATRASVSRRKATQPGTWASLSPCKKSGPLNP